MILNHASKFKEYHFWLCNSFCYYSLIKVRLTLRIR